MNKPKISIIVAIDKNRAIGKDNGLLWQIPEDLKHFRDATAGHPIIMGRKTHLSIGRALPDRENIVITSDKDFTAPGCHIVHSLDEAINLAKTFNSEEIFVIGGGRVYAEALPLADKLYITLVSGEHKADVFFPKYEDKFKRIKEEFHDNGQYQYTFMELIKQ